MRELNGALRACCHANAAALANCFDYLGLVHTPHAYFLDCSKWAAHNALFAILQKNSKNPPMSAETAGLPTPGTYSPHLELPDNSFHKKTDVHSLYGSICLKNNLSYVLRQQSQVQVLPAAC